MGRVAIIGFEDQNIGAANQRWTALGGSPTITTTAGEFKSGAAALKITCPAAATWVRRTFSGGTVATARFYVKRTVNIATSSATIFCFGDALGNNFQVRQTVAGKFDCLITGGSAGLSANTYSLSTWYQIDVRAECSGTGSRIDVTIDGGDPISCAVSTTASTFANYLLGNLNAGPTAGTFCIDDVEVDDGDVYPIGPGRVLSMVLTGRGTDAQGSGAFQNNSSVAITGADTSYNLTDEIASLSGTDFIKQTVIDANGYVEYTFADPSPAPGLGCNGIALFALTGGITAAAHTASIKLVDGSGNVHPTVLAVGGSTTAVYSYQTYSVAPDLTSWDPADVNALKLRWGFSTDVTPNPKLNVVVVEAGFRLEETDALALTAPATPTLKSELRDDVDALALTATGTLILSGDTAIFPDALALTATATPILSGDVAWFIETLVNAANAPPTLSREAYGTKSFTSSPRGFVANVGAGTNGITGVQTTIEIPITVAVAAGDTVVGVISNSSARTVSSITDTNATPNTYTVHSTQNTGTTNGQIFSGIITTPLLPGDVIIVTLNASTSGRSAVVSSFGGMMTGYLDSVATANNNPASSTSNSLATGAATTYADEIIVRGLNLDNTASGGTGPNPPAGYTLHQSDASTGTIRKSSIASRVISSTGVQTDQWTWGTAGVSNQFVIALKLLATIETLGLTANVTITAGEETNFETKIANAVATLILSAETYVPVSGSPYIESLALTATATPTLSAETFQAAETVALTATATPTLSSQLGVYVDLLVLTATATPIISAFSVFFNDGPLPLTATATPSLSGETFQIVETLGLTATATLVLSGETFIGGSIYTESLALTATATPVIPTETFIDISGSPTFASDSIFTCVLDTAYASKITVAEAGLAIRGNVYLDGLGSAASGSVGKMKLLLYDVDGSGFPRNLIATGAERTITKGQTAIWVQSDFGNIPIPAGDYWLGPQIGGVANVMRFHRATLATGNRWTADTYSDGANSTWAFDGTKVGGYKFSVYLESSITTVTGTAYTDTARIANATATCSLSSEIYDPGGLTGQPAGFHGIVERTGSATSGVTSSMTVHAARPWTKGVAIAAGWQDLEPNYRAYVWPTAWENSFIDACDNGYKIIPRIFSGDAAPDWLFTGANSVRGGNPATQTVYLISVEGQGARYVPVPWDPTLRLHYTALLDWLNTKLNTAMPGGRPGTYADYVIAVPITLPTTQGSEMPQAYGSGTWTGVYKGVSGTWDLQSNNKREWLSVASSGTTDAEKQASTIADLGDAWSAAVLLHVGHLTNVHSSLAVGGLFTDNQAKAIEITNSAVWTTYKDKLECYSTNLRTNPNSPYTWRSWNPKTAQCYDHVNAINGICANQTASDSNIGPDPVPGKTGDQADPFKRSLIEARDDFNSYYIEITTSKATAYQTWLRDVFQPTLIPSSSSSTSEIISLTANASPSLSAESVTATGSFIETRVLAATATLALPSEVYDGADLLQLNIPATLILSKEGGLMIETLFLTATSALSSIVSERMVQVELLTLALTQVLSLSKEDAGFPLPPYDMYLDVGIFDVSYNVQIQSNDQNVEIANYNLTVEV